MRSIPLVLLLACAMPVGEAESALDNGNCAGSCCSPSEIEGLFPGGVNLVEVTDDMTLCAGQTYRFPFEITGSGTSSNDVTLDCRGSTIWGGDDLSNLHDAVGIRVRATSTQTRSHIHIKDCVVAGWKVGIMVSGDYAPHTAGSTSPERALTNPVGGTIHRVFDHRDLPLPSVPDHVDLTNLTVHRNVTGLDYSARHSSLEGLRAYKNRGHGIHLGPHTRAVTLDENGSFTLNIYDNGLPDTPGCVAGSFGSTFCTALQGSLSSLFSGIAIDSGHDITIQHGTVNNNGRHGIAVYKNCGEHLLDRTTAYHRRSMLDRDIDIIDMKIRNHTRGWRPNHSWSHSGYESTWEMVTSAGVMIGARQGLKNSGQQGCTDLAGYVFDSYAWNRNHWNDITHSNAQQWHHWDFARGVTVRGGTIAGNSIGIHVADSNTNLEKLGSTNIDMWLNTYADVFIGNYVREHDGHEMLSASDTLVGAPPVTNVDLSGLSSSDEVFCTTGTAAHSSGVINGNCTQGTTTCLETLVDYFEAPQTAPVCGVR